MQQAWTPRCVLDAFYQGNQPQRYIFINLGQSIQTNQIRHLAMEKTKPLKNIQHTNAMGEYPRPHDTMGP